MSTETIDHPVGSSCPVEALAISRFGEKDGMALLFNATCFPCDDTVAMEQLRGLIAKADAGATVDQLIAAAEEDFWREIDRP